MPQATRRWISEKVKSLNESNVLPFHDILDAKMVNAALASAGVTFKNRIDTPFVTLCMFLSQVLDPDHSCRAAVARLIVWLVVNDREPCSPETNSYSDARLRLPWRSSLSWSIRPLARSRLAPATSGPGKGAGSH